MEKKEKFRSLSLTLIFAFLGISTVVLVGVSSLNVYFNFKNQETVIARLQHFISQDAANTVKNFSGEKMNLLQVTASIYGLIDKKENVQEVILSKLLNIDPAFRKLVIYDADGIESGQVSRLFQSSLYSQIKDQSVMEALTQTKKNKKYISPVYIDKITNEPMVLITVQITDSLQTFAGILLADVNLKLMWDLVGSIKVGDEGVAYVVDKDGNLIAFGDTSRVLKGENLSSLKEVSEFVKSGEDTTGGKITIAKGILGTYVVTTHTKLGMPDWAVIVELPILEAYSNAINTFILSLGAMVVSFVLTVIVSVYITKRITKPINLTSDSLKCIADGDGDLTKRLSIDSNNEIGLLAKYFNTFTISLGNIIKQITEVSNNAKKGSDSLSYSSKQSSAALEKAAKTIEGMAGKMIVLKEEINISKNKIIDINNNISKISELIANQSSDISESSVSITQMLASINNILNITKTKYDSSNSLLNNASRGNEVIQETTIVMKEISESTNIINDFIEMINNIASQTNILSMNAAIEATQAGEYGKGFSVIADQIRALADTTAQYSKEISKSLKKIIEHIQLSNKLSLDTGSIFSNILHGIKEISNSILEIRNAMEELASGSNQILTALNSLVDLSSNIKGLSDNINDTSDMIKISMVNTSDSSNEINDSIKAISISINEIYKDVKTIAMTGLENFKTITELEFLINKFKIR